jgi:hypothetical protein
VENQFRKLNVIDVFPVIAIKLLRKIDMGVGTYGANIIEQPWPTGGP